MSVRQGNILRSLLVYSALFIAVCLVLFLLVGLWLPGVDGTALRRPFLGAFATWTIGVGLVVFFGSLRFVGEGVGVLASTSADAAPGDKTVRRSELLHRWASLAEYWSMGLDETGAVMSGRRGTISIRSCDRSLQPAMGGDIEATGWYLELSGIPDVYRFQPGAIEARLQLPSASGLLFEGLRTDTLATLKWLLRVGARFDNNGLVLELTAFDEDLFDSVLELCEDLADTEAVCRRLNGLLSAEGAPERQRLLRTAMFSLPSSVESTKLAKAMLRDADLSVRVQAASYLGEEGVHLLESIAARPNSGLGIRLEALVALANHDPERALEIPGALGMAVDAIKSNDEAIVLLAIRTLEYMGDSRVIPRISPLASRSQDCRVAVGRAVQAINARK